MKKVPSQPNLSRTVTNKDHVTSTITYKHLVLDGLLSDDTLRKIYSLYLITHGRLVTDNLLPYL